MNDMIPLPERVGKLEIRVEGLMDLMKDERLDRKEVETALFTKLEKISTQQLENKDNLDEKIGKIQKVVWMGVGALSAISLVFKVWELIGKK